MMIQSHAAAIAGGLSAAAGFALYEEIPHEARPHITAVVVVVFLGMLAHDVWMSRRGKRGVK